MIGQAQENRPAGGQGFAAVTHRHVCQPDLIPNLQYYVHNVAIHSMSMSSSNSLICSYAMQHLQQQPDVKSDDLTTDKGGHQRLTS